MTAIASFTDSSISKLALKSRFSLLDTVRNKVIFILILFIFSILFLDMFVPFNIEKWYDLSQQSLFPIIVLFSTTGTLTLVFTQFGLRKWLHLNNLSCAQYFLWVIGEIVLISIVMSAIDWQLNKHPAVTVNFYAEIFKYTLMTVIIPYSASFLILYALQMQQLAHVLSKKDVKPFSVNLPIVDEKGKIVLTLHPDHLLFLKSEDNYVDVYYLLGGKVRKELIRTTLKKIEEKCNYSGLIRVHRSFAVNIKHISSSKKTAKGYLLRLDLLPDLPIPVSASYQKQFTALPFTPL